MSCDCHSYNADLGTVPEVVLSPPPGVAAYRTNPDGGICVDACIARVVDTVWHAGFVTLGSCCGHDGRTAERPSLILEQGEARYDEIRAVIAGVDDRPFDLLQWQLVTIGAS